MFLLHPHDSAFWPTHHKKRRGPRRALHPPGSASRGRRRGERRHRSFTRFRACCQALVHGAHCQFRWAGGSPAWTRQRPMPF
ncbi:hypothetical protein XMIN_2620 [Xanthomonas citri pv. mangiferaeindicae LMG 941]|nr:hypothetical protein XMIN_2620 [Xanthomonas citri pv. mangiferaeindicae LMG 941]